MSAMSNTVQEKRTYAEGLSDASEYETEASKVKLRLSQEQEAALAEPRHWLLRTRGRA